MILNHVKFTFLKDQKFTTITTLVQKFPNIFVNIVSVRLNGRVNLSLYLYTIRNESTSLTLKYGKEIMISCYKHNGYVIRLKSFQCHCFIIQYNSMEFEINRKCYWLPHHQGHSSTHLQIQHLLCLWIQEYQLPLH